jgi:hypothetical protein
MRAGFAAVSFFAVGVSLVSSELILVNAARADDGRCSLATVRGEYAVYGQGTVFVGSPPQAGLEVDVGLATIDGKGNLKGSLTFSFNGKIFRTAYTGAYLVNADCTISLTIQDDLGEHLQQEGVVLEQGEEIRFIGTDPGRVIARVAKRLQ